MIGGDERTCGCPGGHDDPHLADCSGTRAATKDDYLAALLDRDQDDVG